MAPGLPGSRWDSTPGCRATSFYPEAPGISTGFTGNPSMHSPSVGALLGLASFPRFSSCGSPHSRMHAFAELGSLFAFSRLPDGDPGFVLRVWLMTSLGNLSINSEQFAQSSQAWVRLSRFAPAARRAWVRSLRFRVALVAHPRDLPSLLLRAPRTPPTRAAILEYRNFHGFCGAPARENPEMRSAAVTSIRAKLSAEPGAGVGPEPVGRPGRHAEHVRGLGDRQPREVAELDQLGG